MAFGALGGVGLAVLPLRGPAETVAMAGIGVAAFGIAWCQTDVPERRLPAKGRPTAVIWACLSLALCLSQLIVYLLADPPAHEYAYPNLTVLLQPVVDQTVWRGALLALWLMAGLALLRWAGSGPGARRGR